MNKRKSDAIIREKLARLHRETFRNRTMTGPFFDEPFFAIPAVPPWAIADPCWECWKHAEHFGKMLKRCQETQNKPLSEQQKKECNEIREQFFKSARAYAHCMDLHYGLGLFKER